MDYEEHSYAKWIRDDQNKVRKRYCAVDPADLAVRCTCAKQNCHRSRLLSLRGHIAELYRVILRVHEEEIACMEPAEWSSVLYGLRMAASIEDVEADTGYVEDPMVFALYEPTIDYEDG